MSLVETLRKQGRGQGQLRYGALIGRVKNTKDPEGLGRVQLEFDFDWQGSHHAAWALPVYPLSGDLGMDVPEVGDLLLCLFQDGSNTQPFYFGRVRGRPSAEEAGLLTKETEDAVRLAAAEEVERGMRAVLDYLARHTHTSVVTAQGVCTAPGAPLAGVPVTVKSAPPNEKVPELVRVGVRRLRLTKRTKPQQDRENPSGR